MSLTSTNLSFSSLSNTDKIIRVFTGSYTAGDLTLRGGAVYVYTIPHGLTRPVGCIMIKTTDGVNYSPGMAFSDATNIYIFHDYVTTGTPVTYKIYCEWIDDYDTTNPLVTLQPYSSNEVQFDSRLNAQKVALSGVSIIPAGISFITVTHTVTALPNVRVYFEAFTNEVWPMNGGGATNFYLYDFGNQSELTCYVTSSALTMDYSNPTGSSKRAWYKLYHDTN